MQFDELPGHAGSVVVRLPDGSLVAAEDSAGVAVAVRARCSCGWNGSGEHPPGETGRMSATSDWVAHMKPYWAAAPPAWLVQRSDGLRDSVAELATTWPLQALGVLAHVERWQQALLGQAVAEARTAGRSWAEIGAALGVSKQSAHERFSSPSRKP
ncbi:hypothetical protein QQG74_18850 [Micromonospora sp. FIMYZ51]|uniref:hypothetical protein n=1 Tax=Micromonospora sp. FIMYZ51 TaxID=3051832 RepID=UPI00312015E9